MTQCYAKLILLAAAFGVSATAVGLGIAVGGQVLIALATGDISDMTQIALR